MTFFKDRHGYLRIGWEMTFVCLGAVVLVAAVVWGALLLRGVACERKADTLGLPHEYDLLAGCFVEVDGQLIPDDVLRENDLLSGGSR